MTLEILSKMQRTYAFSTVLYEAGSFYLVLKFLMENNDPDLWEVTLVRGDEEPEKRKRKVLPFKTKTLEEVKVFAERELLRAFPEILEYFDPPSAFERIVRES
jgi:hypothetical protein